MSYDTADFLAIFSIVAGAITFIQVVPFWFTAIIILIGCVWLICDEE